MIAVSRAAFSARLWSVATASKVCTPRSPGPFVFFNRDDGCKQKITLWPCLFKRASFFVRFEWPFLPPGLGTERRRAEGLSRRAGGPREAAWS